MSFIHGITGTVLPFLIILTLLVFVHEMGHFLIARRNGVRVEVFSIGFGPELFGWTSKTGTRWKISALPLGGYVKMFGDTDAASTGVDDAKPMTPEEKAVSFHHKRVGQRAAIVVGGPLANFLFAILLMSVLYMTVGQPMGQAQTLPSIGSVVAGSAAEAAGFQPGDLVKSIDGTAIETFQQLSEIVQKRPGQPMDIVVARDAGEKILHVTPASNDVVDRQGNHQIVGQLGIVSKTTSAMTKLGPAAAVGAAVKDTWNLCAGTLKAIGQMVAGTRGTEELGGILRIASLSGQVTQDGLPYVVWFIALLSINLGLINLFPIPVLDGGHLMFYAAEALRGRPLGKRVQEYGSMAGLAAVLALMIFATWNDLVQMHVVAFFASLIS
jgi:regulator of sigma E protease